ncbi:hypothetical protein BZA77DRAFT_338935 [Pyronema omphalodes]|nr:hypothetical protein BZA77DRAFT_338935 [Pyronema omphalodes]
MKATLLFAAYFMVSALGASIPKFPPLASTLNKRAQSPDGTCGGSAGFTCSATSAKCCSKWGWCGDSSEHCGTGCQSAFGQCRSDSPDPAPEPVPEPIPGQRPKIGNVPYGSWIYGCSKPGAVALTYDDGPWEYTSALLDILKNNNVRATFFVNGDNFGSPADVDSTKTLLIERMVNEGHQVASHTWNHANLANLNSAEITNQMSRMEQYLINTIGKYPTYMRPPYYDCDDTCMQTMSNLGYHVINCNINTQDFNHNTPATIQTSKDIFLDTINTGSPAEDGWITLAHDVHYTTVHSLTQDMINIIKQNGYTATTVGDCLNDPPSNWYRT